MCDEQFDVSEKMKKLFDIKQKQRSEAKAYFQNLLYNPHRPGPTTMPFDQQLLRFSAMSAYHASNFEPSRYLSRYILYLSPFAIFYYVLWTTKQKEEERLRSGVVKYSDRPYRQIY